MTGLDLFPLDLSVTLGPVGGKLHPYQLAVVAEWLRRLTRNQIPSGSVGSNPTDCENIFKGFFFSFLSGFLFQLTQHVSNVGSVVECSPATRAARVRFPDVARIF